MIFLSLVSQQLSTRTRIQWLVLDAGFSVAALCTYMDEELFSFCRMSSTTNVPTSFTALP